MKNTLLILLAISAIGLITSCAGGVSGSSRSCNTPNQRASDGSRCGGRAASVR